MERQADADSAGISLSAEEWILILRRFLLAYRFEAGFHPDDIVDGLFPFFLARLATFIDEYHSMKDHLLASGDLSVESARKIARHEAERGPIGEQYRADRAQDRGNAIERDGGRRVAAAESVRRLHHGGLQPIDADRLLVATLLLKADVDIVAIFDHLLGGLGEPRLVAIDRRHPEDARQEGEQADDHQRRDGMPVRARRPSERSVETQCEAIARRRSDSDGHSEVLLRSAGQ